MSKATSVYLIIPVFSQLPLFRVRRRGVGPIFGRVLAEEGRQLLLLAGELGEKLGAVLRWLRRQGQVAGQLEDGSH